MDHGTNVLLILIPFHVTAYNVEEWPQVFSDPVLANAAIDRMFEAANICIFQGESYRMKGRILMKDFDKEN